jgi:hypothetical protein
MTQQTFRTEGAKITAFLDGPDWDGVPAATVGGFSCKTAEAGRAVLAQATAFIKDSGKRRILGPMDGDTWHSYRTVTQTDNSPAFLMEPTHQPHVIDALQAAGFAEVSSYFSARVPIAQAGQTPPSPTTHFAIEAWDGQDPEGLFGQVFALSTKAFAGNAFYKPVSRDAFLAMYMPMVPMLRQDLIFFARRPDQSLAGFLFGTPDFAEGPNPKSAILKTYASLEKGAGQHLAYAFHTAAAAAGFKTAIHALIHDDNLSAMRSASEGADVFRRYGLFGLRLDD